MANFFQAVVGTNGGAYKVALAALSFELSGAGVPDNLGGAIASVRRLEDTALPFFRITPLGDYRLGEVFGQLGLSVKPATGVPLFVHDVTGVLTDDGGDVRQTKEFDVAVYNLAGTRVDTDGVRVTALVVTRA